MKDKDFWYYLNYWLQLAAVIVAPPILGLLLGRWLDKRFELGSTFTLALFVLGVFTGLWSMYKEVTKIK